LTKLAPDSALAVILNNGAEYSHRQEERTMKLISALTLCFLSAICQAQQSTNDPKVLYNQAMNALSGAGLTRNSIRGVETMKRSAEMGYGPAQLALGYFYETGENVAQNSSTAADWYKRAALNGEVTAQWVLGRLYYTGSAGVRRDPGEAEKWLLQAAQKGDPNGQYLLGLVKEDRNYTEAPEWFRKAAEQGLPQAQQKLGIILKNGRGVPTDKQEAYIWLLMSLEGGMSSSAPELATMDGELGTSTIEHLKTVARERRVLRSSVANGCMGWEGEFDRIPSTPPLALHRYCH
jgi:TPR repeat protein